jgi:hypothetical protein
MKPSSQNNSVHWFMKLKDKLLHCNEPSVTKFLKTADDPMMDCLYLKHVRKYMPGCVMCVSIQVYWNTLVWERLFHNIYTVCICTEEKGKSDLHVNKVILNSHAVPSQKLTHTWMCGNVLVKDVPKNQNYKWNCVLTNITHNAASKITECWILHKSISSINEKRNVKIQEFLLLTSLLANVPIWEQ